MSLPLLGKVCLVTGASHGIGKAIALELAKQGADVIVSARGLPDLERVSNEIKRMGRNSLAVSSHANRLNEIHQLVDTVKNEYGKIDILVNNAGGQPAVSTALDVDERFWDVVMDLNLKGMFFLSQLVARMMIEQGGGNIVNVASVVGIMADLKLPQDMMSVYSISKAGVIMATKVLAHEWAKYNIRVNAIAPGLTYSRRTKGLYEDPNILKPAMALTPISRIANPEEMVGGVVYLASEASSYVTGHTLVIDGGMTT